jgi:DNA-binding NtrC family response regulator/tetratricopeptide (TPR) repeat protein
LSRRRPDITPNRDTSRSPRDAARHAAHRAAAVSALREARLFLDSDSYREAIASFSSVLDESFASALDGSEKAQALCGLARCYLALGELTEAARHAQAVSDLFIPGEDNKSTAEAQVILARAEAKGGRFESSLDAAGAAYHLLRDGGDSALLAEASKALGTAHAELGNVTAARDSFVECLVCCKRLGDEEGVAGAYNNLGILAKRSGDLAAAVDYFESALEIDERLGRSAAVARRLNNLGLALYRMSRWDEAEEHLLRALDVFTRLGATRDVVSVESALGNLCRARRDWSAARAHLDVVLEKSREGGYLRSEALALEFIGDLEKDRGDYTAALTSLDLALAGARRLSQDSDVVGEVLRRRAEVFLALGRLDQAEQDCKEALAQCRRVGDKLEEGSVLRVHAAVCYAKADVLSAHALCERAERTLRRTGATFELAMAFFEDGRGLGRLAADGLGVGSRRIEGDPRDLAEARLCAARDLFVAIGCGYWAGRCSLEIARALRGASDNERAATWLNLSIKELAGCSCESDLKAAEEVKRDLDLCLSKAGDAARDRYTPLARAATLLGGEGDPRAFHNFACVLAEAVSADRVVVLRVDDEEAPMIVTLADSTGRRLAEVRRFVRAALAAEPRAVPVVAGQSGSERMRVPHHLAAVALLSSSGESARGAEYLLYADRIKRHGAHAFGFSDLELLGAAAGLLEIAGAAGSIAARGGDGTAAGGPAGAVARDSRMLSVFRSAEKLGRSDIPVLILGESGVGKDVVAQAIHGASGARGRLIALNAAAIPRELQESELFGHVRGAFTDADRDREGLIASATDGTLFLDEVGEMSPELQVKLLRFLQSGEYRRVGESVTRTSNARVISASNRDLREEVAAGTFRRDLFYRLSTFVIEIPPLRERIADIEPLMNHFLSVYSELEGKTIHGFSAEVAELFRRYDWHGNNVRELENEVRRAVAFCEDGGEIRFEHIRPELAELGDSLARHSGSQSPSGVTLREEVESLERARILQALEACSQNKRVAAESLGMSRTGLYTKMKKYMIE